uniref:BHLH domain-containing protein n=1 Tax=Knipowitschia caucasica TaxID=637954 RepID=A0AAV2MHR9_KNICA
MNSLSSLGFGHALLPPCFHGCHGCHGHIPHMSTSMFDSEPAFVRRRNERERERVRHVNQGYARLRQVLPPSLDPSLDSSPDQSLDQRLDPSLSRERRLGDLSSLHKMRKREVTMKFIY